MAHKYDNLRILLHDACMINAIADLKEFPSDEEIREIHAFSPVFKKRMAEMMEECFHCKNKDELTIVRNRHLTVLKKFAAAAAVSVAFTFSCAMSVEAIRDSLVKTVIKIYDDHLRVSIDPEYNDGDAVPVQRVEKYYEPGWVPDNYTEVSRRKSMRSFCVRYQNGDKEISYRQSLLPTSSDIIVDFDAEQGEFYEIEGYGTYSYANGVHRLIWSDGTYNHLITCQSSKEDMLRMAKSMQESEEISIPIVVDHLIREYCRPSWLPDQFVFRESEDMDVYYSQKYISENNGELTFFQCRSAAYVSAELANYDLDSYTVEEIPNFGKFLYAEGADSLLCWEDGEHFFLLSGTLSKEDMIAVAESVKPA